MGRRWVSSVLYFENELKKYEGNSARKKLPEERRWMLKRLADDDVLMFEQQGSVSNDQNMKEDNERCED